MDENIQEMIEKIMTTNPNRVVAILVKDPIYHYRIVCDGQTIMVVPYSYWHIGQDIMKVLKTLGYEILEKSFYEIEAVRKRRR